MTEISNSMKVNDLYYKHNEYQRDAFKAGVEAAKSFDKFANCSSMQSFQRGFEAELSTSHRYLQNETLWALIKILATAAEYGTDPRNEHAVKACKKIVDAGINFGLDVTN